MTLSFIVFSTYDTGCVKDINAMVVNPEHKKDIPSGYFQITVNNQKRDEVWKIEYSTGVKKGYIFMNKAQTKFYNVTFGACVTLNSFIIVPNFFQNDKLSIVNVTCSGNFQSFPRNVFIEHIENTLTDCVLSENQPFFVEYNNVNFTIIIKSKINHHLFNKKERISIVCDNDVFLNTDLEKTITLPLRTWNMKSSGIGGLEDVAEQLFRRAFASRQNPEAAKKLGIKHVKGVLLHGPPGCGKTSIARTMVQLLEGVPPKIVSGPEIFDKYVGESEKKIRDLFSDAENDDRKYGDNSPLHVIIFDEFDSIGGKRSTNDQSTSSNVGNKVVNQLLTKMDGQMQLNNILIIALTNFPEAIDAALMRPGRFEIVIEVKLPDKNGRKDIFDIHCSKMIQNSTIDKSVTLSYLAEKSRNFTGAEIEGLIRNASSYALQKTINIDKETSKIYINDNNPTIHLQDFEKAFDEMHPKYGIQEHKMFYSTDDTINNDEIDKLKSELEYQLKQQQYSVKVQTLLIRTNAKTKPLNEKVVGQCAKDTQIGCLMCIDYFDMIGMNEYQKCNYIKKVYVDVSKADQALIVVNDINTIIGYNGYHTSSSSSLIQTIMTLMRYYVNVKTIVTMSLDEPLNLLQDFDDCFDVSVSIANPN